MMSAEGGVQTYNLLVTSQESRTLTNCLNRFLWVRVCLLTEMQICLSELVCETACDANTHLLGLTKSKCLNVKETAKKRISNTLSVG